MARCVRRIVPGGGPGEPARRLDLIVGKAYCVITVEGNDDRLLGESGGPYLDPALAFRVVDGAWDDDWIGEEDAEVGTCTGPTGLPAPVLFEDYFDHDPAARSLVNECLRRKGMKK